jgi:DNA replication protein DnaC
MNHAQTLEKLKTMRLFGMENALRTTMETREPYTADEIVAYLTESEWNDREERKFDRNLKAARFRYQASVEEIDFQSTRNLDKNAFIRLADCSFIRKKENLILTGPTGTGKSFVASALGHQACARGYKVAYHSTGKLFSRLKMARADATWHNLINRIEKMDLLILDDFGLHPLDAQSRLDLLEIIEDRHGRRSTIIATQIPVSAWFDLIGEKTIADAILDRIVHTAHRIELSGESMRKMKRK